MNSVTLALVDYCDTACETAKCRVLGICEHVFFGYFIAEIFVRMIALGIYGPESYFTNLWNCFDFFIVFSGTTEYIFAKQDFNISAIRSLRILRPLRAISRIPTLRVQVAWIIDTLPVLGNVLLFVSFMFSACVIVGVQLWGGILRQRCFLSSSLDHPPPSYMPPFYKLPHEEYVCSRSFGLLTCDKIAHFEKHQSMCVELFHEETDKLEECKLWVMNYTDCRAGEHNPSYGSNFDNFGQASLAIFQVIGLQAWTKVMYLIQDAFSFWSWIFFFFVVLTGSYFAVKLCLVVIAAQFSVTLLRDKKQRAIKKYKQLCTQGSITEEADKGFYQQCVCELIHFIRWVCRLVQERLPSRFRSSHQSNTNNQAKTKGKNKLSRAWQKARSKMHEAIDAPTVQAVVSVLISINTIIMALEHHNQAEELTTFIEVCNIVFTSIFLLEVSVRFVAVGLEEFVQEPLNMLDSIVLLMNFIDIVSTSTDMGGLSVLRIFRLFRLVKLLRFFPTLQSQLLLMLHTLDNVTIFILLFIFVTFISALLGMSLFGCKFCNVKHDDSQFQRSAVYNTSHLLALSGKKCQFLVINSTTAKQIMPPDAAALSEEQAECIEARFDNLFDSMFTVLQVFTRDDWIAVMRTGMLSTSEWASLYFIFLITIGDFIIFNILVGILVEGFSNKQKGILQKELKQLNSHHGNQQQVERISIANVIFRKIKSGCVYCLNGCGNDRALFIFSPTGKLRRSLQSLLYTRYFDRFSLLVTLATLVVIAFERPSLSEKSLEKIILEIANHSLSILFGTEAFIKILAFGFILGKNSYMRSPSNILDLLLVSIAIVQVTLNIIYHGSSDQSLVKAVQPMRLLRTLRPLRLINRSEGLRNVLKTLVLSFKPVTNIVLICCFFFFVFAILGVQLFKGCLAQCVLPHGDDEIGLGGVTSNYSELLIRLQNVTNRQECLENDFIWQSEHRNFDNIFNGLMTLFVVSTKDGWASITRYAAQCKGPDLQPTEETFWSGYFYFIFFQLIVCFFALNMFVGILVNNFQKVNQLDQLLVEQNETVVVVLPKTDRPSSLVDETRFLRGYSKCRRALYHFVTKNYFEYAIMGLVTFNVALIAIEHYQMDFLLKEVLDWLGYAFLLILVLEICLKIVAFGPIFYCRDKWNLLDLVITTISLIGVFLELMGSEELLIDPSVVQVARIFRVIRVIKLIKTANNLKKLLDAITNALPQVINLSALFLLLFFVFSCLGVELYGNFQCDYKACHGLSRHYNFSNFGLAMLTLFRVFTGDGWNEILQGVMLMSSEEKGQEFCYKDSNRAVPCSFVHFISPIYFTSFIVLSQFILINIVVAVLMEQISALNGNEVKQLDKDIGEIELMQLKMMSDSMCCTRQLVAIAASTLVPPQSLNTGASPTSGPEIATTDVT